jgi:cell division transport system permease protein
VEAALAALHALPEVAEARIVDATRLAGLLRPWLGEAVGAVPLPVVLELRLATLPAAPEALAVRLGAAVPGAAVEAHGVWVARLVALARSLQGLAFAILALVAGLAAAVVAVAVRAGIAARRDAIAVLHDLGATDGDIAGRFAGRAAWLTGLGGLAGTLLALPVLALLAELAAPMLGAGGGGSGAGISGGGLLAGLALLPWQGLLALPPLAAALGWIAAQATVRIWLRRLP